MPTILIVLPSLQLNYGIPYLIDGIFDKGGHLIEFKPGGLLYNMEFLIPGLLVFLLSYITVFQHGLKDQISTFFCYMPSVFTPMIIPSGIIGCRIPDQPRQNRHLLQGQVIHVFLPKIILGGGLNSIVSLFEIDGVQIGFQYLILGEFLFQFPGQVGLLDFPCVAPLRGQIKGFHQLLGYCAGPLYMATLKVIYNGTAQPDKIHTLMLIKALILDGNKGLLELYRDLVQGRPYPVFKAEVLGYRLTILIVKEGSLAQFFYFPYIQGWSCFNDGFHCPCTKKAGYQQDGYPHQNYGFKYMFI